MAGYRSELHATFRRLRQRPGHVLAVVLTMGLAIAGVATALSLVEAVLWRPLDVPGGERVLSVVRQQAESASLGLPNVGALREELASIEAISAVFDDFAMDRTDGDAPVRLQAALVESHFFDVVASRPLIGRLLQPADDVPGAAAVVVLSERYWRTTFAADPAVLGHRMMLSGVPVSIVGVAPEAADVRERQPQLWAPIPPFAPWAPSSPGSNNFEVLARRAATVPLSEARQELQQVSARLAAANGTPDKQLDALPLVDLLTAPARRGLWALSAATGVLLLLAVANVSALVLVQVSGRRSELAMRAALGADRARLLRMLLLEGTLLGLAGGALGVALAAAAFALLQSQVAWPLPRLAGTGMDPRLLALVWGLSGLCALLFTAWPAWRGVPVAPQLGARSSPTRGDRRGLSMLMMVEVALACALLGGAALLARSYQSLSQVTLGFDPDAVIAADIALPEARYNDREAQSRAFTQMVDHLLAQPGVLQAAMVVGPPLSSSQRIGHDLLIDGQALDNGNARYRPFVGDYFATLGLPLRVGRGYQRGDEQGERVAWVNERFVARYLPNIDPIGQRIAWPAGQAGPSTEPQWMRIVGVVADVRSADLRADEVPAVYAPYLQREASWIRFGTLLARSQDATTSLAPAMRAALASADGSVAIGEISALAERSAQLLATDRMLLRLIGAFALLALLLGVQGVFGVVAFAVQQRRRELGVRLALGATPLRAAGLLVRGTMLQVLAGALTGLLLVLVSGQALRGLLFGVQPADPLALGGAVAALGLTALLAACWPAWRARRQDLTQVLRAD